MHEEVVKEMLPCFRENYGNPSSIHKMGRVADKAIQNARRQIASLINAEPEEILLTSFLVNFVSTKGLLIPLSLIALIPGL